MVYKGTERRGCERFKIPGAVVSFKLKKHSEEFCPVEDISRGGVMFLSEMPLEINSNITLNISIPGERAPLSFKGQIRWLSFNKKKKKYQNGLQFNPYGEKKGYNYLGNLVKIIELEQKFLRIDRSDNEGYEIVDK